MFSTSVIYRASRVIMHVCPERVNSGPGRKPCPRELKPLKHLCIRPTSEASNELTTPFQACWHPGYPLYTHNTGRSNLRDFVHLSLAPVAHSHSRTQPQLSHPRAVAPSTRSLCRAHLCRVPRCQLPHRVAPHPPRRMRQTTTKTQSREARSRRVRGAN